MPTPQKRWPKNMRAHRDDSLTAAQAIKRQSKEIEQLLRKARTLVKRHPDTALDMITDALAGQIEIRAAAGEIELWMTQAQQTPIEEDDDERPGAEPSRSSPSFTLGKE